MLLHMGTMEEVLWVLQRDAVCIQHQHLLKPGVVQGIDLGLIAIQLVVPVRSRVEYIGGNERGASTAKELRSSFARNLVPVVESGLGQ
jgi:hypothetical protein